MLSLSQKLYIQFLFFSRFSLTRTMPTPRCHPLGPQLLWRMRHWTEVRWSRGDPPNMATPTPPPRVTNIATASIPVASPRQPHSTPIPPRAIWGDTNVITPGGRTPCSSTIIWSMSRPFPWSMLLINTDRCTSTSANIQDVIRYVSTAMCSNNYHCIASIFHQGKNFC